MTLSSRTPEIRDYFLQQKIHKASPPPPKKKRVEVGGGERDFFPSSLTEEVVGWLNAEAVPPHNFFSVVVECHRAG